MSLYELLNICLAAVQSIVLIVVLVVYAKQLRAMQRQVETSRDASVGQNLLTLTTFLQSEDVREARRIVITQLAGREFKDWDEGEQRAAARVCSSYCTVGTLVEAGLVPFEPLVENWGPSIRRCHPILDGFIKDLQTPERNGPGYLAAFERLHSRVNARAMAPVQEASWANARAVSRR
jgi:hypothetical protein